MRGKKDGARTEKVKIIILSLVLAVVAWVAIMWIDDPDIVTTLSDLEVRFIGETELRENGLVITGKEDIPVMSASVSGKRSDLMDYMDRVRIEVDASQITEAGEYTLPGSLFLPSSRISVEKEKYGDIPITVEKLAQKEIEVRVKQTGTLKNKLVQSVIDNPIITITGARSEIDAVSYAVATVDISKIKEDNTELSGYVLMDEDDEPIARNETVETKVPSVSIFHSVYELKNVPVDVTLSAELSQEYALREVTVSPQRVDIGVIAGVSIASAQAVINSVGNDGEMEAELVAGDGLYIPETSKTVKVRADLKKIVTRKLELDVNVKNAPAGNVRADKVTVNVTGEEDKLGNDSVRASADLSGLGSGTHRVKVEIEGEGVVSHEDCYTNVTIE